MAPGGLSETSSKHASRGGIAENNVDITDANGYSCGFVAQAFSNGRTVFVMVSERSARRLGRRLRVEAVGSAG